MSGAVLHDGTQATSPTCAASPSNTVLPPSAAAGLHGAGAGARHRIGVAWHPAPHQPVRLPRGDAGGAASAVFTQRKSNADAYAISSAGCLEPWLANHMSSRQVVSHNDSHQFIHSSTPCVPQAAGPGGPH